MEDTKTIETVPEKEQLSNFIRNIIDKDLASGKHVKIITRFPPEPNGYLHIGHTKSICLNFGIARDYNGICHLRFDDTNPTAEDVEYVDSIMEDIHWLGWDWGTKLFFASDYYDKLYEYAEILIQEGKAFVCDLSPEEMNKMRGTLKEPGQESPWRNRSIAENLDLFRRMKAGEFVEGSKTLRAKIDMSSGNINMRDPVIYRIKKAHHHRTGDKWCIYPMYDYTHCISDALEGITHSICTLEFEDHRPLYDWFLDQLPVPCHPQQIEFARLNMTWTVMSKRLLLTLVKEGYVSGWDDPRMPTVAGMRRRGFPAAALRELSERIGVAKASSTVDFELLQFCVREELNKTAKRVMAVLDPLPIEIENYPEDIIEYLPAENNPEDPSSGNREIPFGKHLLVEREDFAQSPAKGWFRLAPGAEVRLKHAYYITCKEVVLAPDGSVEKLICTYDPASKGGWSNDGRKVKGTLHWINRDTAVPIETRLYSHLFTIEDPMSAEEGKTFLDYLDPNSLVVKQAWGEPSLLDAKPGESYQFLRLAYFSCDPDTQPEKPVFNRVVPLKDSWGKKAKS